METWFAFSIGGLLGLVGLAAYTLLKIETTIRQTRDMLQLMHMEQEGERKHQEMLRFHEKAKHTHLENMRRTAMFARLAAEADPTPDAHGAPRTVN